MQTQEFELAIGDAVRIGDRLITLIDLDGAEAAFRVDDLPFDASDARSESDYLPPSK